MQTNTLADTIEYIKDITGQSNLSTSKAVRALNYAVDHYTYLALTSSGTWAWDSTNHDDLRRITTTINSATDKVTLEADTITIQLVEILVDGKYHPIHSSDIRDDSLNSLSSTYAVAGVPQRYDFDGRQLYIYPTSDSSRTLRVTVGRAHPRFTTSDLTVGVGVSPIHEEYIAIYAADRVMLGTNDPSRTAIRNELTVKEQEIRDLFSKRNQTTPTRVKSKIPSVFMRGTRGNR